MGASLAMLYVGSRINVFLADANNPDAFFIFVKSVMIWGAVLVAFLALLVLIAACIVFLVYRKKYKNFVNSLEE